MSYLVLARKSRPALFNEVVGQKAVVRTLQNALAQNRVAHAMIFSGVRGVGKTTLARIMAKALNCEQNAPESEPCNQCRSCREISSGGSVDLVEIDGASNRGIQEIRELKENIRFMPTASRYKIIIIDEVHMLTTEAFNALLKTLEEPPEHVYFMFATTEMHRVPVTILSRCQRYELKRIATNELAAHFKAVAAGEKVEMDQAALNIIVREAGGSVRDGLSLLDQVFSYCGAVVSGEDVTEMLGLVSQQSISSIADALLAGNIDDALGQLDGMYDYGLDLKRFINDLLAWFRSLVVCSVSARPEDLLDLPEDSVAGLKKTAAKYPARTLTLMFNALLENLEKAGFSSHPRFAVEMAFIKAVHAREVVPVSTLLGRLDELLETESADTDKKKLPVERAEKIIEEKAVAVDHGKASEGESVLVSRPGQEAAGAPDSPRAVEEAVEEQGSGNAADIPAENTKKPEAGAVKEPGGEGGGGRRSGAGGQRRNVRQHWAEFIHYVRDRKPWMASALQLASAVKLEGDQLLIHYPTATDCGLLKNREHITPLTEFALDFFQENFKIRFVLPDAKQCEIDQINGKTPQQERQALASDSLVLTAVDIFNGEVGDIRVGPRFRKTMDENEQADNDGPAEN
ncbi:MAG: DNA polymerase III subunit gamma/tau [Desulfobulbaceae bacterium]|nr:DNA polymerase III subunit gamma/tau [Desulfobulbaceae bacterium]